MIPTDPRASADLLTIILNSATAAATVVLAVFAAVQIWQVRRESRERHRAAFASLYTEFLRIQSLNDGWADEDLLALARNDGLQPDDMLPRDWGTTVRLLGEVGSATGALGAMAYQTVAEAATRARMLIYLVTRFPPEVVEKPAREFEQQIKDGVRVAAETFQDAMHQAPAWLVTHPITIVDPNSEIGVKVQKAMLEAQRRPSPRRRDARLGPLGRLVGRLASRFALWCDPALEGRFTLPSVSEKPATTT